MRIPTLKPALALPTPKLALPMPTLLCHPVFRCFTPTMIRCEATQLDRSPWSTGTGTLICGIEPEVDGQDESRGNPMLTTQMTMSSPGGRTYPEGARRQWLT
ncbi:hypothetical protein Taro_054229 [Colocasia esculenta]|uniref:Uncharacterized protein n=1 Tax=Colocasia esculenta TaxID=4460 RepID=A0A843XN54_COLES|nr:hypothetical protein [Colocasia esculenta]